MNGAIACVQGQPRCVATTPAVADGTSCGADQVCRSGTCVSCKSGVACTTGCQVGQTSCATGVEECIPTGNVSDGTSCGSNEVCHAGVCGQCQAGLDCAMPDPCVRGVIACSTGQPVCTAAGNRLPGTSCNSGQGVCDGNGACTACVDGSNCGTVCSPATIVCATGAPVCTPHALAPDFTPCGTNGSCIQGECKYKHTLGVVTGDGQSGIVGQPMQPVVFKLTDENGAPVAGAVINFGPTAVTDAQGLATFSQLFFPDYPGPYTWTAMEETQISGLDAWGDMKVTAVAPAAGTITTLVNISHQPGTPSAGQSVRATLVPLTQPAAMVPLGANLFFADGCRILEYRPWTVSIFAGGDCAPSSGDGGTASAARFAAIRALAYDPVTKLLLVAEPDRIRAISASNGQLSTVAGGPNPPIPGDGDGGQATAAVLTDVQDVAIGPDGAWYVSANGRIRRIDGKRIIQPWYTPASPANCGGASTVVSCDHGCRVAWDAQKRPWMTANLCGGGVANTGRGLALLDQGAFVIKADGLGDASRITYDGNNGILLVDPSSQEVRRIDTLTSAITVLAGTGTAGDGGDLGPANQALLHDPAAAVLLGGHVVISDGTNHCIRRIW
jgi:hypothetical protein